MAAGHLFSGRSQALVVEGRGRGYLKAVCDYVHLNPARARLQAPAEPRRPYRWSSWPEYLKPPSRRWNSGVGRSKETRSRRAAGAEARVREELAARDWTEATLAVRRKGDGEKVRDRGARRR